MLGAGGMRGGKGVQGNGEEDRAINDTKNRNGTRQRVGEERRKGIKARRKESANG